MNDLPNVINSHLHLFADDIAMYTSGTDPALVQHKLNSDLASLFECVLSRITTLWKDHAIGLCACLILNSTHIRTL